MSQAIGKPVKLMWTRNDDMRHGRVRPRSHHQLRAVHAAGEVLSYEHLMSCVELDLGSGTGQALVDAGYVNPEIGSAFYTLSQSCPYHFGVVTESLNEVSYDMPTATWRSVYSGQARTAEEILVDEIAKALGADAVDAQEVPQNSRGPGRARHGRHRRQVGPRNVVRDRSGRGAACNTASCPTRGERP